MNNREFINKLSDEEFAEALLEDSILCMACVKYTTGENSKCPYETQDCLKCIVKFLREPVEE